MLFLIFGINILDIVRLYVLDYIFFSFLSIDGSFYPFLYFLITKRVGHLSR
jgi:hypothetical protein